MRPGWSQLRDCPLIDNVLDAVELATNQLSDPTRPLVCPICIYGLVATLGTTSHEETITRLTRTHHQFWVACVAMVSAPGVAGGLSSLRHILDRNYLTCTNGRTHFTDQPPLGDSVAALITALNICICLALDARPPKGEPSLWWSNLPAWPRSSKDIIPLGLGPYVRWACVLPVHWSMLIICRVLSTGRRSVIQQLLTTPNRERMAAIFVRALRDRPSTDSELPSLPPSMLEHDVCLQPILRAERSATAFYAYCIILVLTHGPDRHHDDLGELSLGFELQLHNALVDAASKPSAASGSAHSILLEAASAISAYATLPLHPLVQLFRETPCPRHAYESLTQAQAVYFYILQRRESRLCGLDCERPPHELGYAQTLCTLCNMIRYCGAACQRRDWTIGRDGTPHRDICPALRKFAEDGVFAPDKTMADFVAAYNSQTLLTRGERRALTIWALTSQVLPARFHSAIEGMIQVILEAEDAEIAQDGRVIC